MHSVALMGIRARAICFKYIKIIPIMFLKNTIRIKFKCKQSEVQLLTKSVKEIILASYVFTDRLVFIWFTFLMIENI